MDLEALQIQLEEKGTVSKIHESPQAVGVAMEPTDTSEAGIAECQSIFTTATQSEFPETYFIAKGGTLKMEARRTIKN